jgi:hypothetical protein
MFKNSFLIGLYILLSFPLFVKSQGNKDTDHNGLLLQQFALQIQSDTNLSHRLITDSVLTRALVTELKQPYSFDFSFDSLTAMKHISSPDKKFKFFSWQIDLGDGTYRQRGAMQLQTNDGSLKLLPFFDNSDFVQNMSIGIYDRKHWMGAIYYDIIPVFFNSDTLYTLLGFDENTSGISKKIIEVLKFEKGEPILGGDYFKYPTDPTFPLGKADRFVYQYKKGSNAVVKYDAIRRRIILSELASTENDLKKIETLVPSGNEKYFAWLNGKWELSVNEETIFE